MLRTVAVVGVILGVILLVNYRAPEDPVNEIDPEPLAAAVVLAVDYPVYLPSDKGWRATSARWEPTEASGEESVWYTGGVYGEGTPFAALSQSAADSADYVAEQTGYGEMVGESTIDGQVWQRYESSADRSLVVTRDPAATAGGSTVVVVGTGSWADLERFAASLEPVAP